MRGRGASLCLAGFCLLQGQTLRLARREPDLQLRFRPSYRAEGQRPLSLVLGGGSAKGLAHIGVMEILDDEGLAEDAITGTSAGALMGGFRAAGFAGEGLRWAFKHTDFGQAIFDSRRRTPGLTLGEEEERQATVIRLDLRPEGWDYLPGESTGRAVTQRLMAHLLRADAMCAGDFARLRAPFACVTSNLSTGRLQTFDRGNLVTAVRASMSIPGVFRPVRSGDQQLVDGGISQYLPVLEGRRRHPLALQLAVDVSDPWEGGPAGNPFSLLGRSLAHSVEVMTQLNREAADLLVRPQVGGFDLFDFHGQVDSLADRGRQAMSEALPALEAQLYGAGGDLPLGAARWKGIGEMPAGFAKLAQACLPEGQAWRRRDGIRLLRRALAGGIAAEAWLVVSPGAEPVLEIHHRPNPVIREVLLEVPEAWRVRAAELLRERGFAAGQPFREPQFGALLEQLLIEASLRGRPLVDLRGSGLRAEGTLRLTLRESTISTIEVDDRELRPPSKEAMLRLFLPLVGKPLETEGLARRMLELDQSLNLQNPMVRLQVGRDGKDWILGAEASDRRRVQVNAAAAYETTWGLHGVLDAWLRDAMIKGMEWRLHGFANRIQQGAGLSFRCALPSDPSQGFFAGVRASRQRFEGDPLLGYFGTQADPSGYQALIENAGQRTEDLFGGLFLRFGVDRKGLAEIEVQRRRAELAPRAFPWIRNREDALVLSAEWDCFDRHSFPSEGLLVRSRLMAGRTETRIRMNPEPAATQERPRGAYLLFRALRKGVVGPVGADFAAEAGMGWRTLVTADRQYLLGGDSSLIGTPSTRFLAPNFAILRAGLPIPLRRAFGGQVQVVPRLDYGRFAQDPNALTAGMRVVGQGVLVRGAVGKFRIETGWGRIRVRPFGPGPVRTEQQLNILIGARPFDLWSRK
ncbi:MAG: patatin-like phospholipase family protein [Acidobacteria bacterium]|nr:patatin-like phospholipase family protein [Acidobacteriota bacterium]